MRLAGRGQLLYPTSFRPGTEPFLWVASVSVVVAVVLATMGLLQSGAAGVEQRPSADEEAAPAAAAERAAPRELPGLAVGVTHTENSADAWNAATAVDRAKQVLGELAPVQNQHIMGWGAGNPEPRPGEYDFKTLDRRIQLITDSGAEPMLTLCCAPDWMKGAEAGSTDWSRLQEAPEREHFDDFANLAGEVALRYPQVRRFVVWNELKGFYDSERNAWDVEAYTDLYNRVYAAVKQARPDALVGGPYVVVDSWASPSAGGHPSDVKGDWGVVDQRSLDVLDHWLEHADGADFIAVDGWTHSRDDGLPAADFAATGKFAATTAWIRGRTDLPVWWTELYAYPGDDSLAMEDPRRAVLVTHALVGIARAGGSGVLLWNPQGSSGRHSSAPLFTNTKSRDGGEKLPMADLLRVVGDDLRDHPEQVFSSWNAEESRWVLRTPGQTVTWSPVDGFVVTDN